MSLQPVVVVNDVADDINVITAVTIIKEMGLLSSVCG